MKKFYLGSALLLISTVTYAQESELLSGEIYHSFEDHFDHQKDKEVFHFKQDSSSSVKELTFPDGKIPAQFKSMPAGSKIKIEARKLNSDEIQFQHINFDKSFIAEDTYSEKALKGIRKVLTIRVDFADTPAACDETKAASYMYGDTYGFSVKKYFDETSDKLFGITGEVAHVTLPINIADADKCDPYGWAGQANTMLKAAGYTISDFKHRMYLLPTKVPCRWAGLGNVNGPTTWVKSCSPKVMAHELGHNIGLGHSSRGTSTYGDASDTMGSSYSEFNAAHKDKLGWIPIEKSILINKPGTYRISPLITEAPSSDPQVLKILKTDTNEYYYLSYRRAFGQFDSSLSTTYKSRLNITKYKGSGSSNTLFLNGLGVGETYNLSSPEAEIKVLALTDSYVEFSLSGEIKAPTDTTAPTVKLTKPLNNSKYPVNAGVTAEAEATDNIAVSRVDFYVDDAVKCSDSTAPYTCLFAMPESSNLKIQARALDAAGNFKDSTIATISNNSPGADTIAPSVSITSPSNETSFDFGENVTAEASASDNVGVEKVEFYIDGSLKCTDSSSPYSCIFKMPEGDSIQVKAKAYDAAGNSKESSVISISNPQVETPTKSPIESTKALPLSVYELESRQPVSCGTIGPVAPASAGASLQGILTLAGGLLISFVRKAMKWIKSRFKK